MANTDRSRQQSGEAPQAGATRQQGGWQEGQAGGSLQQRGSQPMTGAGRGTMPAQRGVYEPMPFGGESGPFGLMRRLSEEMDRLFESFGIGGSMTRGFGGWPSAAGETGLRQLWSPHIEVCERGGKLVIQADLPGVRKEDVNVQVEQDQVVIHGERKQESSREEQGYYHSERSYGSFYRSIPLPEGVDSDQAKASFRDGVLEIELPASQQRARGRRLDIADRSEAGIEGTSQRDAGP